MLLKIATDTKIREHANPWNGYPRKTLDYVKHLNKEEKFQASEGWLHVWKTCYNMSFKKVLG